MKLSLTSAVSTLIVGTVLLSSNAVAQSGSASQGSNSQRGLSDAAAGRATLQNTVGYAIADPFGPRMNLTGSFGDAPGYDANLFSVNAFIPNHIDSGRSLFFESVRGSVTFDGNAVANVGVGYRQYSPTYDRIFGVSFWGDIDDAHTQTYYRTGVSLESRGKYLDLLLNGYIIVGEDSRLISDFTSSTPIFTGNFVGLSRSRVEEFAFGGFDVATGGPLPMLGRYGVSAYLGGYYRTSEGFDDIFGVSVQTDAYVTEDVNVSVRYAQDDVFGAQTFATVNIVMPSGPPSNWFKPRRVKERLSDPVQRDTRIAAHIENFATFSPLLDPTDGLPIFVQHLDPDAPEGPGTYEAPAGSVAGFLNTAATDIVRVQAGETTPSDLDGLLTLFPGQRLLSESLEHTFLGMRMPGDPIERFLLPDFNPAAPLPTLTNSTGTVIVMGAGFNEVSGFIFDGTQDVDTDPLASGYVNPTAAGFDVNRNTFLNVRNGALITNVADGTGVFEDNDVFGAGATSDLGLSVRATAGSELDLRVADNDVINVTGPNEDLDDNFKLDPGEDVNGNGVLDRGTGIEITAGAGSTINAADPVILDADAVVDPTAVTEVVSLVIENNTVNSNGQGMAISSVQNSTVDVELHGNVGRNNQEDGLSLNANTDGDLNFVMGPLPTTATTVDPTVIPTAPLPANAIVDPFVADNIFEGNGARALDILAAAVGGNMGVPVPDVLDVRQALGDEITGSGVHVRAFNGGLITGTMEDTQSNDNAFAGLAVEADNSTIMLTRIFNNRFNRLTTGAEGIHLNLKESDSLISIRGNQINAAPPTLDPTDGTVTGNPIASFGIGGKVVGGTILLNVGGPVEGVGGLVDGNMIDGNVEAGIGLIFSGETPVTGVVASVLIQNNEITNTTDFLSLDPTDTSLQLGDSADFIGDGTRLQLFDASLMTPSLVADNLITGNEGFGVAVDVHEDATLDAFSVLENEIMANASPITGEGGGVSLTRHQDALLISSLPGLSGFNVLDNIITDHLRDGVNIFVEGGMQDRVNVSLVGNEILRNDGIGVRLRGEQNAVLNIDILSNWINDNGQDGIQWTEDARGTVAGIWLGNEIARNGGTPNDPFARLAIVDSGSGFLALNGDGFAPNGNGIFLAGNAGVLVDAEAPTIEPLFIHGNRIDGNTFDGIEIVGQDIEIDENPVTGATQFLLTAGGDFEIARNDDAARILNINGEVVFTTLPFTINGTSQGNQSFINIAENVIINNAIAGVDVIFDAQEVGFLDFDANRIGIDEHDVAMPNGGDGIEFTVQANGTLAAFGMENIIAYNGTSKVDAAIEGGRGIDMLARVNPFLTNSDPFAFYNWDGNDVSSNFYEGVWVMNTASPNQLQDDFTDPLLADGLISPTNDSAPRTEFRFVNNNVDGNGSSGFEAGLGNVAPAAGQGVGALAGLALWVGSSDWLSSGVDRFLLTGDPSQIGIEGLFASEEDLVFGQIGGVIADISDNTFSGNTGADVFISGFTSTIPPPTVNPMMPRVEDPMARLDLRFLRNVGDELSVNNIGALYNNPDAIKSPSPPFGMGNGDDRNAQRLQDTIVVGFGSVNENIYAGSIADDMMFPPNLGSWVGDAALPDITGFFEGSPVAGVVQNTFVGREVEITNVDNDGTDPDSALIIGESQPTASYGQLAARLFQFSPPFTGNGVDPTPLSGDQFNVFRTARPDNFDTFMFDLNGDEINDPAVVIGLRLRLTSVNAPTAAGAPSFGFGGNIVDLASQVPIEIIDFFGNVAPNMDSALVLDTFFTDAVGDPAAPGLGSQFELLSTVPGIGASTFRVEIDDPFADPLAQDSNTFTFDNFFALDILEGIPGSVLGPSTPTLTLPFEWGTIPVGTVVFPVFPEP